MKFKLESLEGLSEEMKAEYEVSGEGFKLKLDGHVSEDNEKLISALKSERDANKTLTKEKASLSKQVSDKKQSDIDASGDIEAIKKSLTDSHTEAMQKLVDQNSNLTRTIEKDLIENSILKVLSDADIQGNPPLLLPIMKNRMSVKQGEDGTYSTSINGEDGKPLLKDGNPLSIKDFASQLKADESFSGAFKSTLSGGSGSPTNHNNQSVNNSSGVIDTEENMHNAFKN